MGSQCHSHRLMTEHDMIIKWAVSSGSGFVPDVMLNGPCLPTLLFILAKEKNFIPIAWQYIWFDQMITVDTSGQSGCTQ